MTYGHRARGEARQGVRPLCISGLCRDLSGIESFQAVNRPREDVVGQILMWATGAKPLHFWLVGSLGSGGQRNQRQWRGLLSLIFWQLQALQGPSACWSRSAVAATKNVGNLPPTDTAIDLTLLTSLNHTNVEAGSRAIDCAVTGRAICQSTLLRRQGSRGITQAHPSG